MADMPKKKFAVVLRAGPVFIIECNGWWLDPEMRLYRFFDSFGTPEKKDDRDVATLVDSEIVGVVPAERFSVAGVEPRL